MHVATGHYTAHRIQEASALCRRDAAGDNNTEQTVPQPARVAEAPRKRQAQTGSERLRLTGLTAAPCAPFRQHRDGRCWPPARRLTRHTSTGQPPTHAPTLDTVIGIHATMPGRHPPGRRREARCRRECTSPASCCATVALRDRDLRSMQETRSNLTCQGTHVACLPGGSWAAVSIMVSPRTASPAQRQTAVQHRGATGSFHCLIRQPDFVIILVMHLARVHIFDPCEFHLTDTHTILNVRATQSESNTAAISNS